jgi:hypothetical protein
MKLTLLQNDEEVAPSTSENVPAEHCKCGTLSSYKRYAIIAPQVEAHTHTYTYTQAKPCLTILYFGT